MKKQVKKLQLKKNTVLTLNSSQQQQLLAGKEAASAGACSFGTRCFVCDVTKPLPGKP